MHKAMNDNPVYTHNGAVFIFFAVHQIVQSFESVLTDTRDYDQNNLSLHIFSASCLNKGICSSQESRAFSKGFSTKLYVIMYILIILSWNHDDNEITMTTTGILFLSISY